MNVKIKLINWTEEDKAKLHKILDKINPHWMEYECD